MTENDEQMLMRFFEEHRMEIADNGFTKQVMHQLPARTLRISWWWTVICWALAIAIFFFNDGVEQLRRIFSSMLGDVLGMFTSSHLPITTIILASVVILSLLAIEVCRLAEDY
ncbi:MAG: DUF5056 domain-containing protein [Prevotella sp.]|nr:DUF5056 domain-containing protein [Prevotella sp.]MBR5060724.1 DUF5056 domain-containing protein [Prevotella sp.]